MFEHFESAYKWREAHADLFNEMMQMSLKGLFLLLADVSECSNSNLFEF